MSSTTGLSGSNNQSHWETVTDSITLITFVTISYGKAENVPR
jgi:hypothetical protein